MELLGIYDDWGQALVATSCLESYGLTPFLPNSEQLRLNPFKILAFGGIRIYVPRQELEFATHILTTQDAFEITDYEPVKPRIWRRKLKALLFSYHPVFSLAIFIPARYILLIWILVGILGGFLLWAWWASLFFISIFLHAEYIAVPALRKRKEEYDATRLL